MVSDPLVDYGVQVVRRTRADDAHPGGRRSARDAVAAPRRARLGGASPAAISSVPTISAPWRCRCSNIACCCGPNRNWRACAPAKSWTAFCTRCRCRDDRPGSTPVVDRDAVAVLPAAIGRRTGRRACSCLRRACCGVRGGSCARMRCRRGVRGITRLQNARLALPPYLRLTKNVAGSPPDHDRESTCRAERVSRLAHARKAWSPPKPTHRASATLRRAIADWIGPCTGTVRGDHPLRQLHLETPSPLGLWAVRDAAARRLHFPRLSQPARPRHRRAVPQDRGSRAPPAPPDRQRPRVRQPAPLPARRQLRRHPLEGHRAARLIPSSSSTAWSTPRKSTR